MIRASGLCENAAIGSRIWWHGRGRIFRAATDREWSRGLGRGDDWLSPRGLSRVLKTLREQRELTQVQLAKKVRVTQPYIAKLEAGDKANPSLDVLKRLARALGVPLTDLLE